MKFKAISMFATAAASLAISAAADAQVRIAPKGIVAEKPVLAGTKDTAADQASPGGQYTMVPMSGSLVCNGATYKFTVNTNPYPGVGMTGQKQIKIRLGYNSGAVIAGSGLYSANQYIFPSLTLIPGQYYTVELVKGTMVMTFIGLMPPSCQ